MTPPWSTERTARCRLAPVFHHNRRFPMQQQPLPSVALTVNVEAFLGLTTWLLLAEQKPPYIGWWRTRKTYMRHQPRRMWWNGTAFSAAVYRTTTDELAQYLADQRTDEDDARIEWCGLQHPHPAGYEYSLIRTGA